MYDDNSSHNQSLSWMRLRRGVLLLIVSVGLIIWCLTLGLSSLAPKYVTAKFQSGTQPGPLGTTTTTTTTAAARLQSQFPRKIWQTWKLSPPSYAKHDLELAKTWTEKNPEWRWEILTDANQLGYVEHHFGSQGFNRPDIVEFFTTVQIKVIKADLLRYLVVYVEGGLYADIDVEALKPIREFIPSSFDETEIDMVIGVETDEPKFKNHPILGHVSRSFCQWTFICKPQLPFMLGIVENAMARLYDLAKEQGVPVSKVTMDFDQIIAGSGPGVFTDVIMQYMNEKKTQESPITWDDFHHIDNATLVSRVLVLPVRAFAAAQTHSRSGITHNVPQALVKHHYGVSNWTSKHSRYKHPVYGAVQECRFNETCVNQWDENVKNYDALHHNDKS